VLRVLYAELPFAIFFDGRVFIDAAYPGSRGTIGIAAALEEARPRRLCVFEEKYPA
jgi:hypothetical protein